MSRQNQGRPHWLGRGRLRWLSAQWEPLSFLTRLGGHSFAGYDSPGAQWMEEYFHRGHSDEVVARMAEAGFNVLTTHFFKGWGLKAEAEEIEWTKKLVEACHGRGIRVFVYVQMASLFEETFFAEEPEARGWVSVDPDGTPNTYPNQYWRLTPSLSHPGFVKYIEKAIAVAIDDVRADGVWLDNFGVFECHCDSCQDRFRSFLNQQFPSPRQVKQLFGFASFDRVTIPKAHRSDALNIAWARYGQQLVREAAAQLTRFARELDPDIGLAVNSGLMHIRNPLTARAGNLCFVGDPVLAGCFDLVYDEYCDSTFDEGELFSRIRCFKLGDATETLIVPGGARAQLEHDLSPTVKAAEICRRLELSFAEAAAFGGHPQGWYMAMHPYEKGRCSLFEREGVFEFLQRYLGFFRENEDLFLAAVPLANVAILRSEHTTRLKFIDTFSSVAGFEQACIVNRIPYRTAFSEDLEGLADAGVDVLVLADQVCLSDSEIERVRAFHGAGGSIVATGETSLYDENLRQRRDYGLADLFGASHYVGIGDGEAQEVFGTERAVFLPGRPERVPIDLSDPHWGADIRTPERHPEVAGFVEDATVDGLPLKIEAPDGVVADLHQLPGCKTVHLLNYDNARTAEKVSIGLSERFFGEGVRAECRSPDGNPALREEESAGGYRFFRLEALRTYAVITVAAAASGGDAR